MMIYFSSALFFGFSTSHLYDKGNKLEIILIQARYKQIWQMIADQGLLRAHNHCYAPPGEKPFWSEIQTTMNKNLAQLFVQGHDVDKKMFVTFDNDKIHYDICGGSSKTDNLKYTTHVRDNKNRYVAHTAVRTATGAPLGFKMECLHGHATRLATA
jgi:hypothetical protein